VFSPGEMQAAWPDLADMRRCQADATVSGPFRPPDVIIPGVLAAIHAVPLPQREGSAFGYIGYTAMTAASRGL